MVDGGSRPGTLVLAALVMATPVVTAGTSSPRPDDRHAIRNAIATLTAEAMAARDAERLPRDTPDFADDLAVAIPAADLTAAIRRRCHRDPFVDAYVRWQLTSFEPDLGPFDERGFRAFLRDAPRLLENPRARRDLVELMDAADHAGVLRPRDAERVRRRADEAARAAARAERFNRPASAFRDWVARRLEPRPAPHAVWLLETCAETVRAGWPPRSIKGRLTETLTAAARDGTFTPAQRRAVAAHAERLAGLRRRYVRGVGFLASGEVTVTIATARIDRRDVDRWIERLAVPEAGRP